MNKTNGTTAAPTTGLKGVSTSTRRLPNRVLVYAREGWGKTSFAAHAPDAIFILSKGEDGLEKLIENGRVKETAHFEDQALSFGDVCRAADDLTLKEHTYRVLVVDTINGIANLLMRQIVNEDFNGSEAKAAQFGGIELAKLAAIRMGSLLAKFDRLREMKKMSILLLAHAEIVKIANPAGPDYDKYQPALERKHIWPELARWLDIILFGDFVIKSEKEKGTRGKAKGGTRRVMHAEPEAWYDAKNRHGMTPDIDGGEDASQCWDNFIEAMKGNRDQ